MIRIIKYISLVFLIGFLSYFGHKIYGYLRDTNKPFISASGISAHCYYGKDVLCTITTNKSALLNVAVDTTPLLEQYQLTSKQQSCSCTIPIKTLSNGDHELHINAIDTTYHKNKSDLTIPFHVDTQPLQAGLVKPDIIHKVYQGKTLHVQFQTNKPIKQAHVRALAQEYACVPESKHSLIYEAFVPIDCQEVPNEYLLSIDINDHPGNHVKLETKFQIMPFAFKKSALNIKNNQAPDSHEIHKSRLAFEEKLAKLSKKSVSEKLWSGTFCTPIDIQKVTTEFGTVRTTQEKGRYMHKALDIINTPKSVVWSTQDGMVVLKEHFADSGNTVVIDHGCGLLSLFFHLDEFADIQEGQKIVKGNPVGKLGKTGYASGYHLHWEMRINNIAIDPMQWTNETF